MIKIPNSCPSIDKMLEWLSAQEDFIFFMKKELENVRDINSSLRYALEDACYKNEALLKEIEDIK